MLIIKQKLAQSPKLTVEELDWCIIIRKKWLHIEKPKQSFKTNSLKNENVSEIYNIESSKAGSSIKKKWISSSQN